VPVAAASKVKACRCALPDTCVCPATWMHTKGTLVQLFLHCHCQACNLPVLIDADPFLGQDTLLQLNNNSYKTALALHSAHSNAASDVQARSSLHQPVKQRNKSFSALLCPS
jgi:hypothetical protein